MDLSKESEKSLKRLGWIFLINFFTIKIQGQFLEYFPNKHAIIFINKKPTVFNRGL
jgi:hypothetical protein